MRFGFTSRLLAAAVLWIILLAAVGCQNNPPPTPEATGEPGGEFATATPEATPEPQPDSATAAQSRGSTAPRSALTGTVTYRERIALSPGAYLTVELRDVSHQDVASTLIVQQVIPSPGQVPISFRIEYAAADIVPGNTYAVQARINHPDGSLAFINDTAYEVLTQGRPNSVDMVLVAVNPPPATDAPSATAAPLPTEFPLPDASAGEAEWVEVPTPIGGVKVEKYESGYLLRVTYFLPGDADCSRHSSVIAELVGVNIKAVVNNLEKRASDGSPVCASQPREGEVGIPIEGPFTPGETYRVRVNDRVTNAFTPPRQGFPDSHVAPSPIEESELLVLEIFPPRYQVRVVSALPRGSSCSLFNGFDVERSAARRIDVLITHHEVTARNIACTEDYPTVETSIPLGADFEPGQKYTVNLNPNPPKDTAGRREDSGGGVRELQGR